MADTTSDIQQADHYAPTNGAGGERPNAARAIGVTKVYGKGETAVRALDGVDVDLRAGEFTAIMGPSGSGKSTLMHCLAGLDRVTSGTIELGGTSIADMGERELTKLRRRNVGFIFQAFNLLPTLDARENTTLALDLDGAEPDKEWMAEVIRRLKLEDRLDHEPDELSGGQQQRVAVARALVTKPAVVFADEPTGNLDQRSGQEVLALLRAAVDDTGQTIVMVTHDAQAAANADRVLFLLDGKIVRELRDPTAEAIFDVMRTIGDGTHG
jgi:putative ABC transport system ATP-binding protein